MDSAHECALHRIFTVEARYYTCKTQSLSSTIGAPDEAYSRDRCRMVFPLSPDPLALRHLHAPARREPAGRHCRLPDFTLTCVAGNRRPDGLQPGLFRTRDGLGLRTAIHRGPASPRGTVVLLQGRAEFVEKYFEVIGDLVDRGFAVATFDWRGQGGSQRLLPDPALNHLNSVEECVQDLVDVIDNEVLRSLPCPVIGLAHSMGAAILLHALARWPDLIDRAVLTAPMIALDRGLSPPGAATAALLCNAVGLGHRPLPAPPRRAPAHGDDDAGRSFRPGNVLTSDERRYMRSLQVLDAAPHLGVGRPTFGWLAEAFRAMAPFRDASFRQRLDTPLLVVGGDDDRVTSTPAALRFARAAGRAAGIGLPGCAHDVLMERDAVREAFWTAFDGFVAA